MRKAIPLFMLAATLGLSSCTVQKVAEKQENGYFEAVKEAQILVNKPFDLDSNKQIIVVPNNPFVKGMVEKIGYFGRVMTFDDLEKEIIRDNKQDEVGPLSGKIGINNIYRKYKKFLYLKFDDNPNSPKKIQLQLINPDNFEEIFIGETPYDDFWVGVNDQNTFYPLFNALITYIKTNSKTYKK